MWNPFKKSKEKQLKEIVAEAAIKYLHNVAKENEEKLLVNEYADSEKINSMLSSNCDIAGVSDNQICFVKNYTYRIETVNEKRYDSKLEAEIEVPKYYDFIISGDIYCEDINELTQVIKLVIKNKIDRVDVFATIGSLQLNSEPGENLTVKADIFIRTPFKEING